MQKGFDLAPAISRGFRECKKKEKEEVRGTSDYELTHGAY